MEIVDGPVGIHRYHQGSDIWVAIGGLGEMQGRGGRPTDIDSADSRTDEIGPSSIEGRPMTAEQCGCGKEATLTSTTQFGQNDLTAVVIDLFVGQRHAFLIRPLLPGLEERTPPNRPRGSCSDTSLQSPERR